MGRIGLTDLQDRRPFGVEEEYLLLDSVTGEPVNMAADLMRAIPQLKDQAEHEYFSSQLETATPICRDAHDAESALLNLRSGAARAAMELGIVLAGTGLPPVGGDVIGTVTPQPRYRMIENEMRRAAAHQYGTGTHVHVEIPSRDAGVEVLARLARWAPALLALTANSPMWCGKPTGFASWRHIMAQTWPVNGYPIGFEHADDYELAVSQFISTGIVADPGMLSWVVRLSDRYPTIELRIADAQLAAADAVSFALLVRALVDRALADVGAGDSRPRFTPGLINSANWFAARNGLGSDLIDPLADEALPAFDLIDRMMQTVEGQLDRYGDLERVQGYVHNLREHGDSASRQLAAFRSAGIPGLLNLYRTEGHRANVREAGI